MGAEKEMEMEVMKHRMKSNILKKCWIEASRIKGVCGRRKSVRYSFLFSISYIIRMIGVQMVHNTS